jgi:hypothetical protein
MQLKSEKQSLISCFLVVLIAYFPVSSFLLSVKNDFFTAYFPLKHFFSSSLQSGVLPLWNPFLNYGFPIYGDISEAWWNPGTWLIAATSGYNVWTFTAELIIYLLIAVWSMFKLSSRWIENTSFRQIAAISYACCGFFVGHLQHFNWISAAAVIPICIYAVLKYNDEGRLKYLAASVFSLTWFVSTAHPGLIIGAIFFLLPLIFLEGRSKPAVFKRSLHIVLMTLACSAGTIYGYAEVLPYTNRSSEVSALIINEGSTVAYSWISFLFSLPVVKGSWFGNDVSLRNCFFGLALLAGLMLTLKKKTDTKARYFLITGFVFLLLASDLILPLYRKIPLLNFIRLNGELRLFSLLSFILSGSIALDRTWNNQDSSFLRILKLIRILMASIFVAALVGIFFSNDPLPGLYGNNYTEKIKSLLDSLNFFHVLMIHALLQFLICSMLIKATKQASEKNLLRIVMAEMIIATLLNLPFTGVGQRTVHNLDQLFTTAPKGIPAPVIQPEKDVVAGYPKTKAVTGDWALMSKQIAQDSIISYPLIFTETLAFLDSPQRMTLKSKAPFFLLSGYMDPGIAPLAYSYSKMEFSITIPGPDTLVVKQNFHNGWKAKVNAEPVTIGRSAQGFLAIPLIKGKNELAISFDNKPIRALLIYQFIMLFSMLVLYFRFRRANA